MIHACGGLLRSTCRVPRADFLRSGGQVQIFDRTSCKKEKAQYRSSDLVELCCTIPSFRVRGVVLRVLSGRQIRGGPTCNDGGQNGDEAGIDCGGSCPPCLRGDGRVRPMQALRSHSPRISAFQASRSASSRSAEQQLILLAELRLFPPEIEARRATMAGRTVTRAVLIVEAPALCGVRTEKAAPSVVDSAKFKPSRH